MSTAGHPDALMRRIEQLAASSADEPEGAALAALVGALRSQMSALGSDVSSVRAEAAAVRADLDGLGGRLTGSVAAGRTETGEVARRVAELGSRLDGLGGRVEDVRRSLATGLERDTRVSAEQSVALEDARGALEARLAVLEDVLDALSERIEALARDGAGTTTELLSSVLQGVRGVDRRVEQQERSSGDALARVEQAVDARAAALEDRLLARLGDVLAERDDVLHAEVRAALADAEQRAARDRAAAQESAAAVRRAVDGVGTLLERSLSGLERSLTTAAAEVADRSGSRLADLEGRLSAAVAGLAADLGSGEAAAQARLAGVTEAVELRLEQVRDEVAGALGSLREDVAQQLAALAPRLDDVAGAADRTSASLDELRTGLAATVADLRERLLDAGSASADVVRTAVEGTGTAVAEAHRALREELLARAEEQWTGVLERLATVAAEVGRTTVATRDADERLTALTSASEALRGSVAEADERVRTQVGALAAGLGERVAELGTTFSRSLADVAGEVDVAATTTRDASARVAALAELGDLQRAEVERLLQVVQDRLAAVDATVAEDATATSRLAEGLAEVVTATGRLEEAVGGFRAEWPTRTYEVVEGARAVAQGVVLDVREEVADRLEQVRAVLASAVQEVVQARSGLDGGTDRLAQAGSVLVGYLEQRDRLLEAERDRVLHEVLDAFSAGLSARERSALAGRVHDAVARRRDARDAERYRTAVGEPVAPTVALPDDVRGLVPPDADEARAQADPEPGGTGSPPAAPVAPAPDAGPDRPAPRPAVRTVTAVARPAVARPAQGGSAVLPGPGKRVPAPGAAATTAGSRPAVTGALAAAARQASEQDGAAAPTARRAARGAAARPADRRGRLDAMPEVPSVAVALDAAAPQDPGAPSVEAQVDAAPPPAGPSED